MPLAVQVASGSGSGIQLMLTRNWCDVTVLRTPHHPTITVAGRVGLLRKEPCPTDLFYTRGMRASGRGTKRPSSEITTPEVNIFFPFPDSMPPLSTDSQKSIVVIDSQDMVSSEPGYGVQRDMLAKAEKMGMISDARLALQSAEAALIDADEMVRTALLQQEFCTRKLIKSRQLVFDLTGGR